MCSPARRPRSSLDPPFLFPSTVLPPSFTTTLPAIDPPVLPRTIASGTAGRDLDRGRPLVAARASAPVQRGGHPRRAGPIWNRRRSRPNGGSRSNAERLGDVLLDAHDLAGLDLAAAGV